MDRASPATALLRAPLAWVRAHPRASVYLLSAALHLALLPFFIHDWDGYVFVQTLRDLMHGQTPYETVESAPPHIYIGDAVPVVNSWYAYPPVPLLLMAPFFALFTFVSGAPWAERMGVKMAFVLGDLLLAYVAAELVRAALSQEGSPHAHRRAAWVEKALLLNPFLIFISAVWGMFDAWILAFFLGAVLFAYKGRPGLAGVAFALACLVKPFPALLGPLLLGFVAMRLGWRATPRFVGAGILAGLLVCLPFFLLAPQGFLEEVVSMHAKRPPQGFTLIGVPLAFGWITDLTGIPLPRDIQPETLSQVSFVLLAAVVGLLATRMREADRPATLLHLALATLVGVLLVSKVVNEQYFVLPLGLAAVAFALSDRPLHRWIFLAYSVGGLVSAVWLGWHFITMIPVDVALWLLPVDPLDAVPRIMEFLHWDGEESYVYPTLLGAASLVPACLLSLRLAGGELWTSARGLARLLPVGRRAPFAAGVLLVAVLLVAPVSAGVLAARSEGGGSASGAPLQVDGPLVGTYYYLWWHNPAHDPAIEFGNWRKGVTQTPAEGYYTVSAGKIRSDFRLMKESGIDLALVSYHEYDKPKMPAVTRLAHENGLLVAPMIELSELYARSDHQPWDASGNGRGDQVGYSLRNGTRDAIVDFTSGALDFTADAPASWRIDGKPVVVYFDSYFANFDMTGEVRGRMVQAALDLLAEGAPLAEPGTDRAALEADFPTSPDAFDGAGPHAALWRAAYDRLYQDFWREVREELEARHGPVYLVSGEMWDPEQDAQRGLGVALAGPGLYDASYVYAPSFTWVFRRNDTYEANYARWQAQHVLKAQHDRAAGSPVIVSLSAAYDDRALRKENGFVIPEESGGRRTYARMWEDALAHRPDVVLVATWNEFYEGTGIEPTKERGTRWLDETRAFSALLKAQARSADEGRILLVTNERGASYVPRVADPDWTYNLSVDLQKHAHFLWGDRVDAVEWNGPAAREVDFSRYSLVVVEPGPGFALDGTAREMAARLDAYVTEGGRALLLGSQVGPDFAQLAPWSEGEVVAEPVLLAPEGPVPIPGNDRVRTHVIPRDATVDLWMENATLDAPALWHAPHGKGFVAVSAFKPQPAGPATLRLLVALAEAMR